MRFVPLIVLALFTGFLCHAIAVESQSTTAAVRARQDVASSYGPDTANSQGQPLILKVQTSTDDKESSGWMGDFRKWLFGWPSIVALLIVYLLSFPTAAERIRQLFDPFGSVKLFGAEFLMNRPGGEDVEQKISKLRDNVTKKFDSWLGRNDIADLHHRLVDEVVGSTVDIHGAEIRSTLYVSDLLFADSLYQLVDYYPQAAGSHGRVFSARYGIIGKAWRLRTSEYEPCVPTDEQVLIQGWGMTPAEAPSAGHGKESFACIVFRRLSRSDEVMALLYLDSPRAALFGDPKSDSIWLTLEEKVQAHAKASGLIGKLETLNRALIDRSAHIDIYHPESTDVSGD